MPPQIAAVQKYILEKDYPEVFGDKHYKTKIQNVVLADLDGDGRSEVIIHYMPHYRQSPIIVIYRVAPDLNVTRVREGLAPGPLQPVSGDYLDSHVLAEAVDMTIGKQQGDASLRRKLAQISGEKFGGVVEYVNFFHMDGRTGPNTYIDMTGLTAQPKSDTCKDFEFSAVRQISAGAVSALGGGNLLAAWAAGKVYLYRIKSFPDSGFLDKEVWTVDVPQDFGGFALGAEGPLRYVTSSDVQKPLAVQCRAHDCALTP